MIVPELRRRFAHVSWRVLDSADHGVAQRRERVIVAAGPVPFPWPEATHSVEALVADKWRTGDYWRRHGIPSRDETMRPEARASLLDERAAALAPWRTIRDTWREMGFPSSGPTRPPMSARHELRIKLHGEVGMSVDAPCRTVGAQRASTWSPLVIEVPGGLRLLRRDEMAALQGFPPDHPWSGRKETWQRQIGNAVPPLLAEVLGSALITSS